MTDARYIVGDTREVTASLPDASVDLILTSPPFLALRSYLPADHPDKHREIGSEATPADFLDVLLDLTEEWARVLAPHGSIVVELGDTYAGSGGGGGDYLPGGLREGQEKFDGSSKRGRLASYSDQRGNPDGMRDTTFSGANTRTGGGRGWPLPKSLCGIPTLYAWSLAYGRNLLRPERETDPWRIRNLVAWVRPNPPVGALGDKFRPATSYLTIACKSRNRWFDLDAVRTEHKVPEAATPEGARHKVKNHSGANPRSGWTSENERIMSNPAGAPPLDWWEIPTAPYAGAHYATYPPELCVRPIKAMCPLRVCTVCGEPSRRIVEADYASLRGAQSLGMSEGERRADGVNQWKAPDGSNGSGWARQTTTIGWTDCGHNAWRNGVVLDPFAGTGTTLAVATGHGRDAIGIDIDERNADLALERIGPLLLTVEHHRREGAA